MPLIVDKEYKFLADSWTDFPRVISVEMTQGSRVVDVKSEGCTVTLIAQELVPDATETSEKEVTEFYLYKTGTPYRKPSSTEFKFWGIFGANEGKCAIYEKR